MDNETRTDLSDEEIVRLLQSDRDEGLRRLIRKYGGRIRGWLRKRYGNILQDCEYDEVLSTASFNAWRYCGRYDSTRGSLGAWYLRIAQHAAIDLLRAENRHRHTALIENDVRDRLSEASYAEIFEESTTVRPAQFVQLEAAVNQLPPLQRAIIEADLAANGRAAAERLALRHNTSVSVIYVSRNKAIKRLRKLMQIPIGEEMKEST